MWAILEVSETYVRTVYMRKREGHDTFVKMGKQRMNVGMRLLLVNESEVERDNRRCVVS